MVFVRCGQWFDGWSDLQPPVGGNVAVPPLTKQQQIVMAEEPVYLERSRFNTQKLKRFGVFVLYIICIYSSFLHLLFLSLTTDNPQFSM